MKNYKVNVKRDYMHPSNGYDFTKEQKEVFVNLGFRYNDFFNLYEKTIGWKSAEGFRNSVTLMMYVKENAMIRFYGGGRHNTPAEMNEMYKNDYKKFMKAVTPIIKELKANGIIR